MIIKTRWQLAIDPVEQSALTDILSACPNPLHRSHPHPLNKEGARRYGGKRRAYHVHGAPTAPAMHAMKRNARRPGPCEAGDV